MTLVRRTLLLVVLLLGIATPSLAQVTTGLPVFGTFSGGQGQDVINLANLNIHLTMPIAEKAGRNLPLVYNLSYDSSVWTPVGTSGSQAWQPSANWGFTTGLPAWNGEVSVSASSNCTYIPPPYNYELCWGSDTYYGYVDPIGTLHPTNYVYTWYCSPSCQYTSSGSLSAEDPSGYTLLGGYGVESVSGNVIYTGAGGRGTAGSTEDTNGNYIGANTSGTNYVLTDTLGQTVLTMPQTWSGSKVTLTVPTGTVNVYYETLSIQTNFGCSGISEFGPTNENLPYMIQLPDGSASTFSYEPTPGKQGHYTGRIVSVGFSNGSAIYYSYTGANDGISCTDGSTTGFTRSTNDGEWTYARSGTTTTVTAPQLSYDSAANQTVYTFNSNGKETSRKIYQGSSTSGTLLRTVNTTWASNGTPATTVTILEDGSTQSEVDTTYNTNGLLTSRTEYDWGSGGHGSELRQTTYTYLSDTNTNYSSRNILNLLYQTRILNAQGAVQYAKDIGYDGASLGNCPTGVAGHDDSNYGCSFQYRGNPTSVTTYSSPGSNPPSGGITKNFTFDIFGNELTAQMNCCQQKTWTYSGTTTYAFPDSVTSGSGSTTLKTSYTYNLSLGALATVTDPNNLVTQYSYNNPGDQLSSIERPDGNTVTISINYGGSGSYNGQNYSWPTTRTITSPLNSQGSMSQTTTLDGSGRPSAVSIKDASGNTYSNVAYGYDALGRVWETSNPYASSPSYWTKTQVDALGRPTKTILPDGEQTTYTYQLQTVTIADPTGKSRKGQADAAGRLVVAYEPDVNNGNSLTQTTTYTYDVLDDLTSVSQGNQTRTYVYDALGRLNSSTIPESGTTCLGTISSGQCQNGYDADDNLLGRTDARGVVTSYTYDGLNRVIGVSYLTVPNGVSSMPNNVCTMQNLSTQANVCFYYDQGGAAAYALGKLTEMIDPSGSETYTYDNMGRRTQMQKVIGANTYTTSYQYNYASELTQITYPSGRQVKPSYDAIGRLSTLADTMGSTNTTYASGYTYDIAQHLNQFLYGNGIYASLGFSPDRLQLICLDYSTTNRNGTCAHDTTTLFGLNYAYTQNSGNNGEITSITDSVDNGRSANYSYDALARLVSATTTGSTNYPQWGLSWTYDRYGNRTVQSIAAGCTAITCPTNSVTVNASTNQITTSGYGYDANGNMTQDGLNTLIYDGENRVTSSSGTLESGTYVYDGNGLRVEKTSGGSTTAYIFSGSKVIAEYAVSGSTSTLQREYVYSGGTLIAKVESGAVQYYHGDQLSIRVMTNSSGAVVGQQGHFPYGEQWYAANTTTKWMFTTYERDSESGNDYAMAREYINRLDRFDALDPAAASTSDPQSLNRYPYAENDPVDNVDPTGKDWFLNGMDVSDGFGPGPWQGFGPGWDEFSFLSLATTPTALLENITDWYSQTGQSTGPLSTETDLTYVGSTVSYSFIYGNSSALDFLGLPSGGGPSGPGAGMERAKLMVLQPNCARFIENVVLNAYNASGQFDFGATLQTAAQAPDSTALALGETTYTDSSEQPTGQGIEYASTNAGSRSVTLYPAYHQLSPTGQGQTLIHEAVHDAFGLTDQQVAQAATGNVYADTPAGMSQASDAFHKQLQKHCK